MSLAAGSRLGPYEVLAPIGEGGMGEVYRRRRPRYDSICDMKRTTLFVDELVESDLQALARRKGRPVAAEVRDALASHIAKEKAAFATPVSFLAIGRSGSRDTAERHENLLWKQLRPHAAPRRRRKRR